MAGYIVIIELSLVYYRRDRIRTYSKRPKVFEPQNLYSYIQAFNIITSVDAFNMDVDIKRY